MPAGGAGRGRRRDRAGRAGRRGCGPRPTRTASAPRATRSQVWYTLDDGALTEVYYPDLGTPAVRDLQFVVSDGKTFAEREREDAEHRIELDRSAR